MSNVPTNLIPTRITGLPEYMGTSTLGYIPYILDGRTYKVQFGQIAAVGAVPSTRVIAAGTGLAGGGDLSENRVISIANGGVGFDQLSATGVVAGSYGSGSEVPVVTVDIKGRVTDISTTPLVVTGYVPDSRLISTGAGLLGGGSLASNRTLSVDFSSATPQALGSATAGVSNAAARGDHVHPAVDLSDTNQTQGALPLGRGGTGDALSPVAGAVVYSTGTKFALADPGDPGQVLTSNGAGEPYWRTITGTGTVTNVSVLTANGFAGTVAFADTTPQITISTTVTGMVKGDGLSLSAAAPGVDYVAPSAYTSSGLTMATSRMLGRTDLGTGAAQEITVGTGLTLASGSLVNSAPDQVVSLTGGTAISIGGSYPSFTITNTAPDQVVSLTGAGTTAVTGTYPNFTITSNDQYTGTVTSVAASGGSTGLTFSGSPITTSGTLTLGGTLAAANGGTGQTTYTDGQLLIGNSVGNTLTKSTLTAGSGVSISNGNGSITISATGTGGTVTSVNASGGSTGLTFSGGPVTSSGTLTLSGTLAVASGGTGANTAGAARTALGAAASGANTDITSIALTSGTILNSPVNATDIANKGYVDSISAGINFHQAVRLASAAALPAYTYNNGSSGVGATITANANGALTLDGVAAATNDRVLIKNETSGNAPYNGVYVVTQTGNGSTPFILTRATDYNTAGTGVNQIDAGDFFLVTAGSTQANTSWVQQTPLPIVVGTTAIVFSQFGAPITYSAGTGLTLAGTVFSITNTGVTASTYGSASQVPVIAVNAQGQITSASSSSIAIAASQVTSGVLAVANGGTGQSSYTDGQLLIGNSVGNTLSKATLTAGSGVSISNGNGSITISATGSGGSVTSVDVSGGTTGLTFSGGPVTSSGTITMAGTLGVANGGTGATSLSSGYVLKGNGTSAVSASIIYDNGTNVGIGTASPSGKLHVISGSSPNASQLLVGYSGSSENYYDANTQIFRTGSFTETMRITSAGNVGIGTSSPAVKLDVAGASTTQFRIQMSGQADVRLISDTGTGITGTYSNHPFSIKTNSANVATFDTAGNVGIGTSSPANRLQVSYTSTAPSLSSDAGSGISLLGSSTLRVNIGSDPSSPYGGWVQASNGSGSAFPLNLNPLGGNVGVGTSSPSAKFTVSNAGAAGYEVNPTGGVGGGATVSTYNRSTSAYTSLTTYSSTMTWYANGSTRAMDLDSSGNLGIGTTGPIGKLQVSSSGGGLIVDYLGDNYYNAGAHYFRNAASTATVYLAPGTSSSILSTNAAVPLAFGTNTSERMRITSAGDVGIGTSSPAAKLDVAGSIYATGGALYASGTGSIGTNLLLASSGASPNIQFNRAGYQNWYIGSPNTSADFYIAEGNSSTYRMYFQSGGNVGIGTSSPSQKLVLEGASGVGLQIQNSSDSSRGGRISATGSAASGTFAVNTTSSGYALTFGIDMTERMRLDTSGNLGIGTSSTGARLQVSGGVSVQGNSVPTSGAGMELLWDGSQSVVQSYNRSTSAYQPLWLEAGSYLRFAIGGTERGRFDSSGNLLVGTTLDYGRLTAAESVASGDTNVSIYNSAGAVAGGAQGTKLSFLNDSGFSEATPAAYIQTRSNDGGGSGQTSMRFGVYSGSAVTEVMRLTSAGNLGIGTVSPATKLNVIGDIQLSRSATASDAAINFGSNANNYIYGGNSTNLMAFATNGSERMRVTSSGNLLLGTSTTTNTGQVISTAGASFSSTATKNSNMTGLTVSATTNSDTMTGLWFATGNVTHWSGIAGARSNVAVDWSTHLAFYTHPADFTNIDSTYERMRIDGAGNVGVGTTSYVGKLSVSLGSATSAGAPGAWDSTYALFGGTTANAPAVAIGFNSASGGIISSLAPGVAWRSMNYHGDGHLFYLYGSEAMRLNAAGNLGIGTSSYSARLAAQVNAGNYIFDLINGSETGFALRTYNHGSTVDTVVFTQGLYYGTTENTAIKFYRGGGGTGGFLTFTTNNGSERMRIDSSGRLMLGTTSNTGFVTFKQADSAGTADIGLVNDANVVNYIFTGGSANANARWRNNLVLFTGGAQDILFETNAAEKMRLTSSGNLRIGTGATDVAALSISRNASTASVAASSSIVLSNRNTSINGTIAGGIFIDTYRDVADPHYSGGIWFTRTQTSGNLASGSDIVFGAQDNNSASSLPSEDMRIVGSSGYVGIGTSNPPYRLVVSNGGNDGFEVGPGYSSGFVLLQAYNRATASYSIMDYAGSIFRWLASGSEKMRLDNNGNLGIGTSSPASLLHVKRGSNATEVYPSGTWAARVINATDGSTEHGLLVGNRWAGTASTAFEVGSIYGGGTGSWYSYYRIDGVGQSIWSNAGTERMRLDTSGNLGLGTSSPGVRLDVAGSIRVTNNSSVQFRNTAGTGVAYFTLQNDDNFVVYNAAGTPIQSFTQAANPLAVYGGNANNRMVVDSGSNITYWLVNGSERMRINSSGEVLMGTSTGGRTVCIYSSDNWMRMSNPSRSWLIGPSNGSSFNIFDETGGANRFYIDSTGTAVFTGLVVGRTSSSTDVNAANDTGSFSVRGDTTKVAAISFHRTSAYAINMGLGLDAVFRIGGWSASSNCFQMDGSGNLTMLGNVTAYSDARMKKDVETIDSALDLVSKMRGVRYTRTDTNKRGVGVIAQEMLEVMPEVVQQGVGEDDTLSVAYGNLVGVLIEAVKELTARVAELEGK